MVEAGPPSREWSDPATAPSGEAARLLAVRVRREDGQVQQSVDIQAARDD